MFQFRHDPTTLDSSPPVPELENRTFAERFRIRQVASRGGGQQTLFATDTSNGQDVVIRTIPADAVAPGALMRLEHEATVLRRADCRSLTTLSSFGVWDGQLYTVAPSVSGVVLTSVLKRCAQRGRNFGSCGISSQALHELHRLGVLHRRINPDEVIVNSDPPITRGTLTDFGNNFSLRLEDLPEEDALESVRYLSPEQSGLLVCEMDEPADLYSAGVVLYQCLAGHPPYEARNVNEILRQHMTVQPPELRSLGLQVPRALDEVLQRLLRKDPRDRYQTAAAVLADIQAIGEAYSQPGDDPPLVIGLNDRRRTLTEPAFVDRQKELRVLDDQLQRARSGHGEIVLVEAESGGGKSRLLAEFGQQSARRGARILRGQGVDHVAQRPYQVLRGVVADLLAAVRADAALAASLPAKLGTLRTAACAALPELTDVLFSRSDVLEKDRNGGDLPCEQSLVALFQAVGSAERPILILLDDCHWADELTIKLITTWQSLTQSTASHVLLVLAIRSEDVAPNHPLRKLKPTSHLDLPLFQSAEIRQLVESMAGPLPDQAIEVVERLAAGNPWMASAALRGLVESGTLVAEPAGWRIVDSALADVQSSRHAGAFLARRIDLLPEASLQLLSVGAVLGKEFDLSTAAKLARQTADEAIAALDEARRRHIVWTRAQDGHCVFMHDKLRDSLLKRLSEAQCRELHRQAGLDLEQLRPTNTFDLAYHFDAAGDALRAFPYALAAAEESRSRHALGIAEQQYRIAQRGIEFADREDRFRVAEGLSDVLMLQGRYDDAAKCAVAARELATSDFGQARIEGKLGELAFRRGDVSTAIAAIERALDGLGQKVPQSGIMLWLQLLREATVQTLHTYLPGIFVGRKSLINSQKPLLVVHLHNRLGYAYWFQRGRFASLRNHLRSMNLAECYPPTKELAEVYAIHAPVSHLIGNFRRGITYAQKSFAIYKSQGDLLGQAQAMHFEGHVHYAASRYSECLNKCRDALIVLERMGNPWEVNVARYHIALSLYRMGELPAAVAEATRVHQAAQALGDTLSSGCSLDVWSRASGGQLRAETVQAELHRPHDDVQTVAMVMLAEGVRLYMLDKAEEAAVVFENAIQLVTKSGVANVYTYPLLPWRASALRRQAEQAAPWNPKQRELLLRRAAKMAHQALRVTRKYQNDLPHALREAGLIAAMRGSNRQARKYLDESLAIAQRQGAKFEEAQTSLARGRVGLACHWSGAAEQVAAARQSLVTMEAGFATDEPIKTPATIEPATLSLTDRFDTMLDVGRKIVSTLSSTAVFAEVREAALKLLRGEECVVLRNMTSRGDNLTIVAGKLSGEFSRSFVRQAMAAGRAVIFAQDIRDDVSESVLLSNIRSALCAPIFVRGRPVACIYLTHRKMSGLFGEDEQRLADFIAALAGAALENAAGFTKLQHLNNTLEVRVAERTADAESRAKDLARLNAELARSNAELQQFAFVASHDLQEPLRKIQAFGDLLQATSNNAIDEQGLDYLQRMQNAATRMRALIDGLLSYSRIMTKQQPMDEVDLREIVRNVVSDLEVRIQESGGCVEFDPLPRIEADPLQMRQLFQNLIGNGLKYQRPGVPPVVKIHCTVGCHQDDPSRSSPDTPQVCEIMFEDNGIGFDEKYLPRLFTPFQRLHSRSEYDGTGIGLAVCRRIVERHHGTIMAHSTPQQGSQFVVQLPLKQPPGD